MIKANEKYTILYARLSQDDNTQGDSNSILNQKLILEKYAKDNNFENTLFLFDDGFTGTNFERPSFKEAVKLIENGEVATFIVKDLSRFGRNYISIGQYTEILFPNYNVRFIAIYDGVDSRFEYTTDFAPMKNFFNELYAKDCSKKIKASHRAIAENGGRVGVRPPFGYMKDPENRKRGIVPDEDTAPIVKYIFSLCVSGRGPSQIAKQLNEEKIPSCSYFYFLKYGVKLKGYDAENPYIWSTKNISYILDNETYIGNTLNFKTTTISYKIKRRVPTSEEERVFNENTHEAIIDKETWDIVQQIRKSRRRNTKYDDVNIFAGLVYCSDCGKNLVLQHVKKKNKVYNQYRCGTYARYRKEACTSHYISENQLKTIILSDLKRVTYYARQNEKVFADYIANKNNVELSKNISKLEREIAKLQKRESELKSLFKKIYEDNALGKISDSIFENLSEQYLSEQNDIKELLPKKIDALDNLKLSINNSKVFIEKARKYTEITELSIELLNLFIEKIIVSDTIKDENGNKFQSIDIYYRDVGLLNEIV